MNSILKKIYNFSRDIKLDDSIYKIEKCDILFFCHDVDRSISLKGKAYSPLIDSIREDLEKRGLKCISISHPWSKLTGEKGFNSPVSINRSYLFSIFSNFLKKKVGFAFFFTDLDSLYKKIF